MILGAIILVTICFILLLIANARVLKKVPGKRRESEQVKAISSKTHESGGVPEHTHVKHATA